MSYEQDILSKNYREENLHCFVEIRNADDETSIIFSVQRGLNADIAALACRNAASCA